MMHDSLQWRYCFEMIVSHAELTFSTQCLKGMLSTFQGWKDAFTKAVKGAKNGHRKMANIESEHFRQVENSEKSYSYNFGHSGAFNFSTLCDIIIENEINENKIKQNTKNTQKSPGAAANTVQ